MKMKRWFIENQGGVVILVIILAGVAVLLLGQLRSQ